MASSSQDPSTQDTMPEKNLPAPSIIDVRKDPTSEMKGIFFKYIFINGEDREHPSFQWHRIDHTNTKQLKDLGDDAVGIWKQSNPGGDKTQWEMTTIGKSDVEAGRHYKRTKRLDGWRHKIPGEDLQS